MTDVTDNFNRANGALGSNWSAGPSFTAPTIVSNVGSSANDSAWHVAYWNTSVNTFVNDQYSEATVLDGSAVTTFAGAIVRHQPSTSSGYFAFPNGGSIKLYRIDSGSFNLLTTIGSGITDGSVIRLEITGTTLNAKVNGTSVGTFTDASYSGGSPGIGSFSSGRLDNWTGGPIAVLTQTLAPNLVAGDDAFFVPVVAATAAVLPALVTDADTIRVPALIPGAITLNPALVSDTDVVPAPVVGSGAAPNVLHPQLVADGDVIYGAAVTYLPILRSAFFNDADLFYPVGLVGGIPFHKHPLTGSVTYPRLVGNLGSRPVLTGTLKRVG